MKTYAAIGHFKDSKNIVSVAMTANSVKDFRGDLFGNEFVPYVVLTENMVAKLHAAYAADNCFGVYDQVKKLTTNYRVWSDVADYIEQCFDIIDEKIAAAKEQG
ncbi:MAG: hypothetical protein J6M06_01955 [Synergistaceae bacterium]|nr:hypothetical protein [Synergistaceae bacterium]